MSQLEQGKATLIAVLEDIRDGRRTDLKYDQHYYGSGPKADGTLVGCLACIALCLEQGVPQTVADIRYVYAGLNNGDLNLRYAQLAEKATAAGKKLLGLDPNPDESFAIFGTGACWPVDLRALYHNDKIAAAIEALNRLQPDGSFAPPNTLAELTVNSAEPVREEVLA